jgi:hypothetical protein
MSDLDLQHHKESVAQQYIDAWKKEFSDSEQSVISSISEKMQKTLVSDDVSVDTITQEFATILSADMIHKITIFLQEKKEILAKTNTVEDLEKLKADIKTEPYEPEPTNILKPLVGGWALELKQFVRSNKIEKQASKTLTEMIPELEKSSAEIIEKLNQRLMNPELTTRQKRGIKKLIKDFWNAEKAIGISSEALPLRKSLVQSEVLGADMLSKIKISDKALAELKAIKWDTALLSELAGKSTEEVKTILKSKGITNLSKDVFDILWKWAAKNMLSDTVHVLSEARGLWHIGKALRGIPFLDIGMAIYDGVEYYHQKKTARNNAHYAVKLGIYGGTAIAWLAARWGLIAAGPWGWVIAGWVAAEMAISHAMDVGYFDLDDFYHQSREDLKQQEIADLKLALVQAIAGNTRHDLSLNEQTYDMINSMTWSNNGKSKTAEDVMYTLIYKQEELKPTSDASITPTEASLKADIEARVAIRMEYLKSYLPGGDKVHELSSKIYHAQGMGTINQLLADSEVYAEIKKLWTPNKSLDTFKSEQLQALKSENSIVFEKLEKLAKNDPAQLSEFLQQIDSYEAAVKANEAMLQTWEENNTEAGEEWENTTVESTPEDALSYFTNSNKNEIIDEETDGEVIPEEEESNKVIIWQSIDFIKRYKKAKSLYGALPLVQITHEKFKTTENMLLNLAQGKDIVTGSIWFTANEAKKFLMDRDMEIGVEEYSTDLRQNIIYRLCKAFHSYTGANTMKDLELFCSSWKEGNANKRGIYFDAEKNIWKINNDYDSDIAIDFNLIQTQSVEQIITSRFQEAPTRKRVMVQSTIWSIDPSLWVIAESMLDKTEIKDMVDTPTETADNQLNKEFFETIKTVLTEEKERLNPAHKESVIATINSYITTNSQNEQYIILPWYLIQEAKRVWLGNFDYYFFANKWWKITALTTNEHISQKIGLPGIQCEYIEDQNGKENWTTTEKIQQAKIKTITPEVQKTVNKVNQIAEKIKNTAWAMIRSGRGEVTYDPLTEKLTSRNIGRKISEKNGKYIVEGCPLEYTSLDEAVHIAIVKNWFEWEYKKSHPDMNLTYESRIGRGKAIFADDSSRYGYDTKLLSEEFITKNLAGSFATESNQKLMIDYLSA